MGDTVRLFFKCLVYTKNTKSLLIFKAVERTLKSQYHQVEEIGTQGCPNSAPVLLTSPCSYPKLNSSLGKIIDYSVNQPISDSRMPRIVKLHSTE